MPSIVKRGKGYRIFVSLGSDERGKPVRRTATFHPPAGTSERKAGFLAESYAYRFESECRRLLDLSEESTLSEVIDWYFITEAPMKLKERTLLNERRLMENYVIPKLGDLKIRELAPYRIDAFLLELLSSGGLKKGQGLSSGTVILIRNILQAILAAGVEKEIFPENPAKKSLRPRAKEEKKIYLTAGECRRLFYEVKELGNAQAARAIRLLLVTGMRRGELLALSWDDVDLVHRKISVRNTLYRKKGQAILTTPKTSSSVREILLPEEVAEDLREQRAYVEELRQSCKYGWKETGACFINRHGDYLNGEFLNYTFRKFLSEHGFPPLHLHDLRHANASLLINTGVPVKFVSEHLGHRSERTTELFYTHMCPDYEERIAEAIDAALSRPVHFAKNAE